MLSFFSFLPGCLMLSCKNQMLAGIQSCPIKARGKDQQSGWRHLSAHHNMYISLLSHKETPLCTRIHKLWYVDTSQQLKPSKGVLFYIWLIFHVIHSLSSFLYSSSVSLLSMHSNKTDKTATLCRWFGAFCSPKESQSTAKRHYMANAPPVFPESSS